AERNTAGGFLRRESSQLARHLDLARVPANVVAVLGENAQLALERLRVAEAVPDVRVLGDYTQRLTLPTAADEDRDVASRCRVQLRPAVTNGGEGVRERLDSRARGAELKPVLLVVALEPARARAENEAPLAR